MKTKFFLNLSRSAGILMGAGLALTASAGTPNLTVGPTLSAGAAEYSLASGDFMGNGQQDLVACDGSVWLNTSPGDGSTSFTQLTGVIPQCSFLAVADINKDGKPDIIETSEYNQVAVLVNTTQPGDTSPSFAAPVYFNVNGIATNVTTADVDGDGMQDLIVTDTGQYTVNILRNTTTPGSSVVTFDNFVDYPTGNGANSVVVGDLDGDGKVDIVVANLFDNTVSVFINTSPAPGTVSFAPQQVFTVGNLPNMVTLADINDDGKLDIVVANNNENFISVLLNSTLQPGNPSFSAEETFATGNVPDSVSAVDLDGDGMPELVVGNAEDGTVSVLHNIGNPGDSTANFDSGVTYPVGTDPEELITTDLNGDGKIDVAVLNTMSVQTAQLGSVSLLINSSY